MAAAAAVPPLQRPDPHARPPEPRPQRSLPAAVLPPPPAAKKARGPKAKAKQKLVYVESTQRTLGKQFHSMQKTLRIVSLSGNDPLVNDFVWLALCSDLVAIGFCNANCSRFIRRKRADFDGVPLALRPHNSDWTVYRRVLNQIPLLHAVHLAAFRWVCFLCTNRVKRASGAGDLPATTLLEINERAAAFLRRLVRPSFDVPAFLAQDPREPLPADASTAKVKFRLTSIGQKLLINSCSTFQPVVPQNLRSRLESSLRSPVLHCPIPVLASDSTSSEERQMPLYVHELSKRTRENEMIDLGGLKWEPYNGERRNGANSTQIVRRCVLQHLCGYIEGCAIFGLRQLFGNGAEFMDRVAMVEHFVEAVGKAVVPDPAEPAASEAAFYLRASPSRHCVGGKLAARGGGGGKAGAGAGAERKDEQQTKYIGRQKRRHRGGEAPPIVSKKSATHLSAAARKRKRKQKKTKAAAAVAQGKKAKKAKTLPHDSSSEEASMLLLLLASTAK
jgi:hypothetical protein